MIDFLKKQQRKFVLLIAFLAGLVYWIQTYQAIHTLRPSLDEGIYLVKGYFLASGVYTPYQPYGFWMNKMPLSFLIPGWVEVLFGPGLLTGRLYALILSILILPGIWLIARRFSGEKVATLILVLMAINPVGIKLYAQAISQVLVAFLLVWSLFFLLGEKRKYWQVITGSALAAIIVFTRENMLPLVLFVVILMFWQHGKKTGWISFATVSLVLIIGHAIYFPEILTNWVKWLPQSLTPFLDPWRVKKPTEVSTTQAVSWLNYLFIFMQAIRWQFFVTFGLGLSWLAISFSKLKEKPWHKKTAIILSSLFIVLFLMHAWASMGMDYCKYCLPGYIAFFSPLSYIILAILIPAFSTQVLRRWGWLVSIVTVVFTTLFGYSVNQDFVYQSYFKKWLDWFFNLSIPWVRNGKLVLGDVQFWQVLANKFNLSFDQVRLDVLPQLIPTLLGFTMGLILIILSVIIYTFLKKKTNTSLSFILIGIILILGINLSPTWLLGGGVFTYDCGGDVITKVEAAGEQLSQQIPPGSKIDWRVTTTPPVLLLYLQDPQILPAQMNVDYSYVSGGETDYLLRYGFWNDQSASTWLSQSDFLLATPPISEALLNDLEKYGFREIAPLSPALQCDQERFEVQIFTKDKDSN